ncbi:unnamed protein product [Prunus brigantina]
MALRSKVSNSWQLQRSKPLPHLKVLLSTPTSRVLHLPIRNQVQTKKKKKRWLPMSSWETLISQQFQHPLQASCCPPQLETMSLNLLILICCLPFMVYLMKIH